MLWSYRTTSRSQLVRLFFGVRKPTTFNGVFTFLMRICYSSFHAPRHNVYSSFLGKTTSFWTDTFCVSHDNSISCRPSIGLVRFLPLVYHNTVSGGYVWAGPAWGVDSLRDSTSIICTYRDKFKWKSEKCLCLSMMFLLTFYSLSR